MLESSIHIIDAPKYMITIDATLRLSPSGIFVVQYSILLNDALNFTYIIEYLPSLPTKKSYESDWGRIPGKCIENSWRK